MPEPRQHEKRTDHGARLLSLAEAITAVRALPPSPKPSVRLRVAHGSEGNLQLAGTAGKINQRMWRPGTLDVFEQLFGRDFEIELRQSKAGMLEQSGFGIFMQALALRIYEPYVFHAPAPVIFEPLG
jgi:hypothetical protein